jgi:ankyrin repeat protein
MVSLLIDLGADPLGVDGAGMPVAVYATEPGIDRPVMAKIRSMTAGELVSAERGHRQARSGTMDLVAALALGDWETGERLVRENRGLMDSGALHLTAKRNDPRAVRWLLDHGANTSARWAHWDSDVTPLHLAILENHTEIARILLDAGADPHIRDTKHDSDALGWAEFFQRAEIIQMLKSR